MTGFDGMGYKRVTRGFFEREWQCPFDIFYEVDANGTQKFVKFAEYDPRDPARMDTVFEETPHEIFYIKETDLYKHYQFNVLKDLLLELAQDPPPAREVFRRVYPVATRILQDYLEIPASDEFLVLLNDLPKVLAESIASENLPFQELVALTSQENATHFHCVNVGLHCLCLARELEMSGSGQEDICLGGLLADIGKKFIPLEVLLKKEPLTEDEQQAIRRHPVSGKKTLGELKRFSKTVLRMAAEHHENFDGSGYPMNLASKDIHIAARICKIADVFNALISQRSYGESVSPQKALTTMKKEMKGQLDPELLTAFVMYAERE